MLGRKAKVADCSLDKLCMTIRFEAQDYAKRRTADIDIEIKRETIFHLKMRSQTNVKPVCTAVINEEEDTLIGIKGRN